MMSCAYVDTNVFIAAYETSDELSSSAWRLLAGLESGEMLGVTSELTLAELLVQPLNRGAEDLVQAYKAMFPLGGAVSMVPITCTILISAAEIRAEASGLKLPDAIHLATALGASCSDFITGDRRLTAAKGLRFIRLGPESDALASNPRSGS